MHTGVKTAAWLIAVRERMLEFYSDITIQFINTALDVLNQLPLVQFDVLNQLPLVQEMLSILVWLTKYPACTAALSLSHGQRVDERTDYIVIIYRKDN